MKKNSFEGYLQRIGFTAKPEVNLNTLAEIQRLHTAAIPFENLNPLLKLPVEISDDELYNKIVNSGRGGYCFENNLLLKAMLTKMGFNVRGVLGRAGVKENSVGRTHIILLVTLNDKEYLVDVGYGGYVPTAPLLFKPNIIQQTPNENFRIRKNKDEYRLEIQLPGEWKRLYDFGLEPQLHIDYEVANWYTSTNPNSKFTQKLVVARSEPGIRYTLSGNLFSIHHVNKKPRKKILTTRAQLIKSLEEIFLINLSGLPLRKLKFEGK